MSVRLQPELEKQFNFFCESTGYPKNTVMAMALTQFLQTQDLARLPLGEIIREDPEERFQRRLQVRAVQHEQALEISGWITSNAIFTKKTDPSAPGDVRPGIYGRNSVVGFCDSFWVQENAQRARENGGDKKTYRVDDTVYVIAQHHSGRPSLGVDSHHRYVMSYEDWKANMRHVVAK